MTRIKTLAILAVVGTFVGSVIAGPVMPLEDKTKTTRMYTMDELVNGDEVIVVEDKIFSNFEWAIAGSNNMVLPDLTGIKVWGVVVSYGDRVEYGLKIDPSLGAGTNQVADVLFEFDLAVSPNAPDMYIVDNTLTMQNVGQSGNGKVQISEAVTAVVDGVNQMVFDLPKYVYLQEDAADLVDHKEFDGMFKEIHVTKDILVAGTGLENSTEPSSAHLSLFWNTFSQVPEPATMSLLGLGGLVALRRRRR
jgi:hypothetical protein